jgi:tetratricopeptide (TPR) repeat protein
LSASPFSHAHVPYPFELRPRLPRRASLLLSPLCLILGMVAVPYAAAYNLSSNTEALLSIQNPPGGEPCDGSPFGQAACNMLRHHPSDFLAPLYLGKVHLDAKPPKLDRAVYWLARALYLNPRSTTAHRLTGRALYYAGKKTQALGEYRLAVEEDRSTLTAVVVEVLRLTNDPDAAFRATPLEASSYLSTARILHNLGKDEAAARAARAALDLDSSEIDALDLLGELAFSAGRLDEAAGVARQTLDMDPLHDRAHLLLGDVFMKKGETDKAEEAWKAGLVQNPESTPLAYRLGEWYLSTSQWKEAENIASRLQSFAASDDSSQAQLNMLFGRIEEAKGMLFEARKYYRMASSLAPDVLPYLYSVGLIEEKLGSWDEAARIYKELVLSHFRSNETKERLDSVLKAQEQEKGQALWNHLVDSKKKDNN